MHVSYQFLFQAKGVFSKIFWKKCEVCARLDKDIYFSQTVECQVCSIWFKLYTVQQIEKISKQPKFEVSNSKNKKSGQPSCFQMVGKILLLQGARLPFEVAIFHHFNQFMKQLPRFDYSEYYKLKCGFKKALAHGGSPLRGPPPREYCARPYEQVRLQFFPKG